MPASGNISAGLPTSNRQTSDSNIDWQAIEESLQDDNTSSISEILSRLDIQDGHSQSRVSETLILTSIEKLQHNDIIVRSGAAAVLTNAVLTNNKCLTPHLISFVRALSQPSLLDLKSGRSHQKEYAILHRNLCTLINEMQFKEPDKLLPNFKPLVTYLVQCTGHDNSDIATGACEYWARLPVPPVPDKYLDPWIPAVLANLGKLVSNLLRCLIYHDEHIKYLESKGNSSSGRETPTHMEKFTNRRNYAAMGLENICRIFSSESLNVLKPWIQKWMNSRDWKEVEAIILAIGAITQALGAPRDLKDLYPNVIMPRLLECFTHPQPLVRAITCFTVQLLVNLDPRSLNIKDPFPKIVRCTLQLLRDPNEEVQQMSAQCLSTMLAYNNKDIGAYGRKLIDEIIQAEKVIRGKARFTYYECIAHLFGRMAAQMERDDVTCLVVPFMNHWNKLDPESGFSNGSNQAIGQDILLLCQPLCTVAMYGRNHMEPYNKEILERIVGYLSSSATGSDSTFTTQKTVAYLDMTSALLEGQGNNLSSILSDLEAGTCIVKVLQSPKLSDAVHQSCLALLGNLSKHCYTLIHPRIDSIIPVLQKDMNNSMTEIRNNGVWALFNIIQNSPDCHSQFDAIGEDLVNLLKKPDAGDEQITVNASLALTSLAAKWPDKYASLLTTDSMFSQICATMQQPFPRDLEKVTLYQNMCKALTFDLSHVSVTGWVQFCIAAALLESPDDALRLKLKNTLHNGRSAMGNKNWAKVTQQIGSQLASTLRRRYRLY